MALETSLYVWDPLALAYFVAAVMVLGVGGGTFLYERFTRTSRYFFALTVVVAVWLTTLGMAVLAIDPATTGRWLRATFAIEPFTGPAWYAMALVLAGARRKWAWLAWVGGAAFALFSLLTPWLVHGLQSLMRDHTLTDLGWLGGLYFLFTTGLTLLGMIELIRSQGWAVTREDRLETGLLSAAALIGSLTLIDYWLPTPTFRAGLLTALALGTAALIAGIAAVRYRPFSIARSFGTDEVMRAMSDAVLVCDAAGRVRGGNRAADALLGRGSGELPGESVSRYLADPAADSREEWVPDPEVPLRDRAMQLLPAAGDPIDVSVTTEPLRARKRVMGTVIVARDIRDRLEAERALQVAQRRYHALFRYNPGMSYEIDRAGRFTALNPSGEKLLGVPAEELLGSHFDHIIDPSDKETAEKVFQGILSGEAAEYDLSLNTPGGERLQIRGVSIPIFEDGEVVGVFGVALDVTEATRIQRELEVQRRYFADLFESSPEGIVLVEAHTDRVRRVNAEFTRMFGWTSEEAVGRTLNELIVPDELQSEGAELNRAAREDGRMRTDTVRRRKDGSTVEVSVLAREVRIPGEPVQLYGVYRDITSQRETERALRQREEELRHAQKLEAVGKLAGGIAHDFNNLLTVINGHARFGLETLEEGGSPAEELVEIENAGARAASLTQQLLAYSRRQVLRPQALDPIDVIRGLEEMLGRLIGEHIQVETRLMDADARVHADRGQLEQVLVNIVMNARDAMANGGVLEISSDIITLAEDDDRTEAWELPPGRYVRIEVCDTGVGMDAETVDRAFEPFFTTKTQGKGTGLGLPTAFGIVKQSGGHMTVRSQPGEGSCFGVILPTATSPAQPKEDSTRPEAKEGPSLTVLVAEDEGAVRKLITRVLERHGCTVLAAEHGEAALALLDDLGDPLDLLVTDLVMPGMGGHALAERVRAIQPDLPVLLISGYDDELVAQMDLDDRTLFLPKPFTPADLARNVGDAVGRDLE